MKNIILVLALCAAVSLDAMHATRKVCKEIPKAIPVALEAISQAVAKEIKARDLVIAAQKMIKAHRETNTDSSGIVYNLRVNLLPALIVASSQTRGVLGGDVVFVSSRYYDGKEKAEEYIQEFTGDAFMEGACSEEYRAYVGFLKHLSKNPDTLKVTQLR